MKTTDNKEMDLLLRALARNKPAPKAGSGGTKSEPNIGTHLDADELNCYAEGVATESERARYVKHLADCASCRHQIANLVPVASVVRREEVGQKSVSSFRNRLSALLSPAALRYAIPALLLTGVLAIALIALREPRQADFVAQRETAPAPDLSVGSQTEKVNANQPSQTTVPPAGSAATPLNSKDKNAVAPAPAQVNQPSALGGVEKSEAKEESRPNATEPPSQPALAKPMEAAAPPPPAPRVDADNLGKLAEAKKQENENSFDKRREEANLQMRDANEADRVSGPRKGPSRGSGAQNIAGLSSSVSRAKDDKAVGRSVETRTVFGRVFYRQGSAWVDTDYSTGRTTISVKRGSEQFRALISDEPGLKSISEQLSGEVFVVWKGTAYRIH